MAESAQDSERPDLEGTTALTVEPKVAAVVAYALWWVTGVVVLVLEKQNKYVRFHAWQSILTFGGITILWWVLGSLFAGMFWFGGAALYGLLLLLSRLVQLAGLALWIFLMYKAYQGEYFALPWVGPMARKQAGA